MNFQPFIGPVAATKEELRKQKELDDLNYQEEENNYHETYVNGLRAENQEEVDRLTALSLNSTF